MPILFVDGGSVSTGMVSTRMSTDDLIVPSTVQPGDLALFVASTERSTIIPTIVCPTPGYVPVVTFGQGNVGTAQGFKRINADDIGGVINGTVGSTRRFCVSVAFYRGADDPVFLTGAYGSALTVAHPAVTPLTPDSVLVSMAAVVSAVTPFVRTFDPASGWTERVEGGSALATAANGYGYIAERDALSPAGAQQAGHVVTVTPNTSNVNHVASTVVLAPLPLPGHPLVLPVAAGSRAAW